MKRFCPLVMLALFATRLFAEEFTPYQNNFQNEPTGAAPKEFKIVAGGFKIAEEGDEKFLELPGAPLDSFSILFGTPQTEALASARIFGTKTGRKFPTFAIGLNGGGGFRLQVSPAKQSLEIFRGDISKVQAPFQWQSGEWTHLKLQVCKVGELWIIQGKAWPAKTPEPADWNIRLEESSAPPAGRATLWGSPFSGTPIRFDDTNIAAPSK